MIERRMIHVINNSAITDFHMMQGSNSPEAFRPAAQKAAAALAHYESAPQPELVQQGQEPQQLLAALGASDTHSWQPQDCAAYDEDFQVCSTYCALPVGFCPLSIVLCLLRSVFCALPFAHPPLFCALCQ